MTKHETLQYERTSAGADDILMSRILDLLFELLDYYKIPGKSQSGILNEISGTIKRLIVESLSSTTESSEEHNQGDSRAATWIKSNS